MKQDELLSILADAPEYFQPLPEGAQRDYSQRDLKKLVGDVNNIYEVVSKLVRENDRLRAALLVTNKRLVWQRRLAKGSMAVAFSAWTLVAYFGKIALPLILKGLTTK